MQLQNQLRPSLSEKLEIGKHDCGARGIRTKSVHCKSRAACRGSALGHKRKCSNRVDRVRYLPEIGHAFLLRRTSAMCQKATVAAGNQNYVACCMWELKSNQNSTANRTYFVPAYCAARHSPRVLQRIDKAQLMSALALAAGAHSLVFRGVNKNEFGQRAKSGL